MSTPAFIGTVDTNTRTYTAATVRYDGYPTELGTNLTIIANRDTIPATIDTLLDHCEWSGIYHNAPDPLTHQLPDVDTNDRIAVANAYSTAEYVYKDFIRARATTVSFHASELVPGVGDHYTTNSTTPALNTGRLIGKSSIDSPALRATGAHSPALKRDWAPDWAYLFVITDGEYTGQLLIFRRAWDYATPRMRRVALLDVQEIAGAEEEVMHRLQYRRAAA